METKTDLLTVSDPEVNVTPSLGELTCETLDILLSANVTGSTGELTYQWCKDGNPTGSDTSTYTATEIGAYTVTITDTCGCSDASEGAAISADRELPTLTLEDVSACDDELPITLTVTTDAAHASYDWTDRPDGVTDPANVPDLETKTSGEYCVIVTDRDNGCTGSDCCTLRIDESPHNTHQPADAAACTGDSATFSVDATGDRLSYHWQVDDGHGWADIPRACASAYTITTTTTSQHGYQYRALVETETCGAVTSAAAGLSVQDDAAAVAPDIAVCEGCDLGELTGAIEAAGGGCLVGTGEVVDNGDRTYTLTCENRCGADQATGNIVLKPSPTLFVASVEAPRLPVTLTADTAGSLCPVTTYAWYTGPSVVGGTLIPGATGSTFVATAAGDYTAEVACDNRCTAEDTASVCIVPIPVPAPDDHRTLLPLIAKETMPEVAAAMRHPVAPYLPLAMMGLP